MNFINIPKKSKPLKKEQLTNFDNANKLILGENLKTLRFLSSEFREIFDILYIDAPYNTGKETFVGLDKKNRNDSWQSMITVRLQEAIKLIKKDGFVLMSIDDYEIGTAREILDSVFGYQNYVATFVWQRRNYAETETKISIEHEYVIAYRISDLSIVQEKVSTVIINSKLLNNTAREDNFKYLYSDYQNKVRKDLDKLLKINDITNYPKPVNLLVGLFKTFLPKRKCRVLDIFAGSGTTAEAVGILNSKYNLEVTCTLLQMHKDKANKSYQSVENLCASRMLAISKKYGLPAPAFFFY